MLTSEPRASCDAFDEAFDRTVSAGLGIDKVPADDTELNATGLDSFGLLNLMMVLEDEFGGVWPLEHLMMSAPITTVGDLRSAARGALSGGD